MFTKKTRVISAIATVCMLISMLACIAIPAVAATDAYNADNTAKITAFTAGSESAAAAYVITNADEMVYAATIANNDKLKNTTVYLAADIDLSGKGDFIGFGAAQFNIDGQGHTISNWKNTTAGQVALVMKGKTEVIKNIKFYDCDLKGANHTALVYGSHNNDGVTNGSLTISNITIENCDITATEQAAFILPNAQKRANVISDIVIINSSIAGNGNNLAALVSRMASGTTSLTVTNVYAKGITITGSKENGGVLIGKPDGGSITPIVKNAVVVDCSMTAVNSAGVLGGRIGGNPTLDNILIYNPTITAETPYYVTGNVDWYTYGHSTNLYSSAIDFKYCLNTNAGATATDAPFAVVNAEKYTSGEQAYLMSDNATGKYTMFWEMENGNIAPTNEAGRTRKVNLELTDGTPVGAIYVDGGETAALSYAEDAEATFKVLDGAATIDGSTLTMGTTGDVTVQVIKAGENLAAVSKAALEESIAYYTSRNISYYVAGAATALADAQALCEANGSDATAYDNARAALEAFKTQYAVSKDNAPSMTEIAKYPGCPVYVIREAADFQAMEDNKSLFDVDDTVYMVNDVDMKGSTFNGIEGFKASFDGQGYEIQNWGIAADGTTKAAINTRGLFSNVYGQAAAIKSLKNVTFVNCHTMSTTCSAMLYGVGHNNAGMAADGAATTLTIENIHFDGCSITLSSTKQEVVAFLLGRYTIAGKDAAINITNCSVTGSTFDASATTTDAGHFGLLIGKPRGGNANEKAHYTLTDCYLANNTIKYSRTDGGYIGVVFGTAEAQTGTKVIMNNVGVVGNNVTIGGTHVSLVGHVQTSAIDVNGLLVKGNTVTGGSAVLFRDGGNVTMKNAYCSDTIANVTTATSSAALAGTNTDAAAAYAVNAVSGGDLWWTTAEGAAVKGTAANATRKVELKLGTGEVVETYYANVGETVTVAYAEEPMAEFSIEGESGTIADGNKVTVNKNADVVVAVSLGAAQELANARAALQEAIDYYTVDRKIEYFKASVATACEEAEALLESSDTAAILAEVAALQALQGEYVDEYPNVPSISEMSKYPAMKNYKIMNGDEMVAADTATLRADGITLHLGANIDLTGKSFDGFDGASCDFDGHGFTVANWTCNNTVGMFGNYKGGTIKNLTVDNANIGGGYGRAVFAGNGVEGNTTFENVHVKNTVVAENSNGNLGGIFFGQILNASTGTIKNCSVVDTEFKTNLTNADAGITNAGVICGRCGKGGETYVVEGLYVDGFMNNANPATTSKGNGILFGTIESALASATVDGAIIVNCGGTAAYELAGWQYNDKVLTYKNIFAAGNDTLALNGVGSATANTTYQNIFTDSTKLVGTLDSTGAQTGYSSEVEGITTLDAAAFKSGEAAYKLNKAAEKTLALVDNSFNAYPVMFATEGYAAPFAVTFVDQSDNNKEVAVLYTNASGKLNETAVTALLENAAYDFKNGEADVTAADVYTADTTLTSNVAHDWENGTYDQLDNNQHKLTCGDEGCTVYKIEDCAHAEYVHRVDGDKHVHDSVCACGRVLDTEDCTLSKTPAGDEQHTVACDTCDYEETVACVFENFEHDDETVGADSTHTGTCACGNDKTEACTFGDWVETTPADYGVCGVETKTCSVAGCGYSYTRLLAMETNTEVIIETESVDLGVNPAVDIYLDIDGLGLAGAKVTILTELEIGAGEFGEAFPFVESEEIEGGIEMIIASDENLTGRVLLASFGLVAPAEAGSYDIEVIVEEAVVISGEGEGAIELPAEVAGATAEVVVREAIPGDVNGDGDITMADAVLVLRVVNGTLNAEEISAVGADVDGVAGITTADAIAILKMVMGNY